MTNPWDRQEPAKPDDKSTVAPATVKAAKPKPAPKPEPKPEEEPAPKPACYL